MYDAFNASLPLERFLTGQSRVRRFSAADPRRNRTAILQAAPTIAVQANDEVSRYRRNRFVMRRLASLVS